MNDLTAYPNDNAERNKWLLLAHILGNRISATEKIANTTRNFPGLPYIFFSLKKPVNVLLRSAWKVHGRKQLTIKIMQAAIPTHLLYFIFY